MEILHSVICKSCYSSNCDIINCTKLTITFIQIRTFNNFRSKFMNLQIVFAKVRLILTLLKSSRDKIVVEV